MFRFRALERNKRGPRNLNARSNTATSDSYLGEFIGQPNYRTNPNKEARI